MKISLNNFIHKDGLKNNATSNINIQQVLKSLGSDSKVRIYLRCSIFLTNSGIFGLQSGTETTWVCYIEGF